MEPKKEQCLGESILSPMNWLCEVYYCPLEKISNQLEDKTMSMFAKEFLR